MNIDVVFPQVEIGQDPAAIRDDAPLVFGPPVPGHRPAAGLTSTGPGCFLRLLLPEAM